MASGDQFVGEVGLRVSLECVTKMSVLDQVDEVEAPPL